MTDRDGHAVDALVRLTDRRAQTRRQFLGSTLVVAAGAALAPACMRSSAGKPSDLRVEEVRYKFTDYRYRTPLKFGGKATDRVTVLDVLVRVRTRDGKVAHGLGSMPLGNVWSFPSKTLTYDQTLGAMKGLTTRIQALLSAYPDHGHPVDITWALEPAYLKAALDVAKEQGLSEPIPKLCALVVASPFDAALHDALGKAYGRSAYGMYGPEFMTHDLAHYLGDRFAGRYLQDFVSPKPKARMPLYHLVGALDPIEDSDIPTRINDGLPETIPEWIRHNGLTHLKIKLNGNNLDWDLDRVVRVDRVTTAVQQERGVTDWVYSLDFNEQCPNVQYLLDFIHRLSEKAPDAFTRVQYVEQPTARDLAAHRENVMHEAAKLKPVVIDESLTDYESLKLAQEMGYSGAALKACKTPSMAMLLGAACQMDKLFLCVQDLTCPGASLVLSAGLSAHVPTVAAIEANARQYVPIANDGWDKDYAGLFVIKDGTVDTSILDRPGMSLPDRSSL
jgi:L-alanine-DL-glutamate epimerase-like enolase superfamily enzyme